MKKTIVRELFIIILLVLVIVLTLRMVIFDFIPNKKTLPESIKYTADFNVRKVLEEIEQQNNIAENSTTESLLKSYIIEESDLKNYVSKKDYKNGKTDPFEDYNQVNTTDR